MVKLGLQISANLENIDELKTSYPNYSYFFKIKCSNCGEKTDKWHDLSEAENFSGDNSRNEKGNNFLMKCKLCSRENSINIVEGSHGEY